MSIPHNVMVAVMVGFHTFWSKRINPISLILNYDSYNGSHYTLHSVLILAVDLSWVLRFSTLSCELTTQALPPACSAVGLPRMEGVATRAIRDATSCQQTGFLDSADPGKNDCLFSAFEW